MPPRDHTCRHALVRSLAAGMEASVSGRARTGSMNTQRSAPACGTRHEMKQEQRATPRGSATWRKRAVARGGIAMRDPELVFKAQLAASALERAWQHWRVIHGLLADPMPTVSSYVGYSLEEPWGQPRVVFGLSADDAEQLAALLDKHDCVGPVHATIAAEQGGREARPSAADSAGWPSVPSQAPPLAAEHSVNASRGGVQAPRPRFVPTEDPADEQDGPVFREVVAAVQR